jgi:type IV secretion system protein VirB9
MILKKSNKLLIAIILLLSIKAYAIREPRATFMDSRIRVMAYNSNDVFRYTGYYNYQGSIEFEEGETIETISMGDTISWQIVPSGNRMFLKPIEHNATTNMTVITNLRLYFFELHAREATDINDPGLVFIVKFLYPDSKGSMMNFAQRSIPVGPDLTRPEKYNFNYTVSGSEAIAPLKIFDDGQFTYFEFKEKNAPLPAFFTVDKKGNESIVNYQAVDNYIVLEMVASQVTLRYGDEITCVFNEA